MHLHSRLPLHIFTKPMCLNLTLHHYLTLEQRKTFCRGMELVLSDSRLVCEFNVKKDKVSVHCERGPIAPYDRLQIAEWLRQQEEVSAVVIAHGKLPAPRTLEIAFLA